MENEVRNQIHLGQNAGLAEAFVVFYIQESLNFTDSAKTTTTLLYAWNDS